ncbi:MAG: PilZ domain-containing protein [Thiobacillus sp.]|nr:PilZ domain-containing protein [Thiobacillus sp.]
MTLERRTEPRVEVRLPLRLDNGDLAITRDVSPQGLFFEIEGERLLGEEIDLSVGLSIHGRPVWRENHYKVVRVERLPGRTGVAVQLLS